MKISRDIEILNGNVNDNFFLKKILFLSLFLFQGFNDFFFLKFMSKYGFFPDCIYSDTLIIHQTYL